MDPVNWLAVFAATLAGNAVILVFSGARTLGGKAGVLAAMFVSAAMLGHNFARIGAATLSAKPWLYPMQAGGLALAFVIPALWISQSGRGVALRETGRDGLAFLLAYLAMGAVFFGAAHVA